MNARLAVFMVCAVRTVVRVDYVERHKRRDLHVQRQSSAHQCSKADRLVGLYAI